MKPVSTAVSDANMENNDGSMKGKKDPIRLHAFIMIYTHPTNLHKLTAFCAAYVEKGETVGQ